MTTINIDGRIRRVIVEQLLLQEQDGLCRLTDGVEIWERDTFARSPECAALEDCIEDGCEVTASYLVPEDLHTHPENVQRPFVRLILS